MKLPVEEFLYRLSKEAAFWKRAFYVVALLLLLYSFSPWLRDDTDPSNEWFGSRSGLALYTDTKTGCQYVSNGNGLVPRVAEDGITHLGCRRGARNQLH